MKVKISTIKPGYIVGESNTTELDDFTSKVAERLAKRDGLSLTEALTKLIELGAKNTPSIALG
jgi:hypothetical protein